MDDPLGLQDPHSAGDLLQEHPDGVLAQRALGCSSKVGEGTVCVEEKKILPMLQVEK